MLSLDGGLGDPRVLVLLDLYYYTVRFCRECGFSREQTSSLFSMVKETHAVCQGTPLGNVEECYQYFKEILLCHAVHRPPFSINLFTQQQVLRISDYFLNTYVRHFKLYKYVFTPQVNLDLSISYDGISEPEETSEQGCDKADITGEETDTGETGTPWADSKVEQQDKSGGGPLREYIDQRLSEEVGRLQHQLDEKIQQSEEHLQGRLQGIVETRSRSRGRAGGKRPSAK